MDNDQLLFLPWTRSGLATAPRDETTGQPVVKLQTTAGDLSVAVHLLGPGDVIGLDPQAVLRTYPNANAQAVETPYFPAIEFEDPALPWMYTPESPSLNQFAPWLRLVVVDAATHALKSLPEAKLPVLNVRNAAEQLPPADQAFAWAHAQVRWDATADPPLTNNKPPAEWLQQQLAAPSAKTISRLLCPRRLARYTDYLACVVPTFEAGRCAGLGLEIPNGSDSTTSWNADTREVDLPVYYSWTFRTGDEGDFESLVRKLRNRPLGNVGGSWPLQIRAKAQHLRMMGALRPPNAALPAVGEVPPWFKVGILIWVAREGSAPTNTVVGPPSYGQWPAAGRSPAPAWHLQLNLDPRNRVAAALGTEVVQRDQEALMASAWDQVAELRRVNQLLALGRFSTAVAVAFHRKRIEGISDPGRLLALLGPVLSRVRKSNQSNAETTASFLRQHQFPIDVLSLGFKRLTRPHGPLMRRLRPNLGHDAAYFAQKAVTGNLSIGSSRPTPNGLRSLLAPAQGGTAPSPARVSLPARSTSLPASGAPAVAPLTPQEFRGLALQIRFQINPRQSQTIARAVRARIVLPAGLTAREQANVAALLPVCARPCFPQPMWEELKAISQDWILTGIKDLPANSVTLAATNPVFIESFMAGLNHEMNREFLWREFPTDRRGTPFQRFWPADPNAPPGAGPLDVALMDNWGNGLGANLANAAGGSQTSGQMTLLLRGELLQRYPTAVIYARKDVKRGLLTPDLTFIREPLFRGRLDPDITFIGFALTKEQVLDQGWKFVIEEQPGEPRFGLDDGSTTNQSPDSWSNLSWGHVKLSGENGICIDLSKSVNVLGERHGWGTVPGTDVTWGPNSDAAQIAWITRQRPVRVFVDPRIFLQSEE